MVNGDTPELKAIQQSIMKNALDRLNGGGPSVGGGGIDDPVIGEAIDLMYGLCANAGQETIVSQGKDDFSDWGAQVLEAAYGGSTGEDSDAPSISDLYDSLSISDSALEATSEIWAEGAGKVQKKAGEIAKETAATDLASEAMDIVGGFAEGGLVGALFGFLGSFFD